MSDGGKGDKRRKGADDDKYREGWDRIFGKRDNREPEGDSDKGTTDGNASQGSSGSDIPKT